MFAPPRRLRAQLAFALTLVANVVVWLPLVVASQTPATAATIPTLDQRAEAQIGDDIASDGESGPLQQSAPFFNALCDTDTGLWAQTITAGMTARLSEVELLLLRRAPDITSAVAVEVRSVDQAGRPTETVLARGSTTAAVPFHRSQPRWLMVPLDAPVPLLRGQKVAIVPTSTPSAGDACYEWISGGLDVYAAGPLAVTYDLGGSFVLENSKDGAFRTWMR